MTTNLIHQTNNGKNGKNKVKITGDKNINKTFHFHTGSFLLGVLASIIAGVLLHYLGF